VIGKAVIGFVLLVCLRRAQRRDWAPTTRAARRHLGGAPLANAGRASIAWQKIFGAASIFVAMKWRYDYVPLAQIRTCLWPCVDR
jgi:hypothetical protein